MIVQRVVSNLKRIAPNLYCGEVIGNGQQNGCPEHYYWHKKKGAPKIISGHNLSLRLNDASLNLDYLQVLTDGPFEAYEQSKTINAAGQEELKCVYKIPKKQPFEGGEDTIICNPVTRTFRKISERIFYGQKHLMSVATFDENAQFVRGQCFTPKISIREVDFGIAIGDIITHYPDEPLCFAFKDKNGKIVKCIIDHSSNAKLKEFARRFARRFARKLVK